MLEDQVVESLQINVFATFQNNQMNYANFPNHDNQSMIWRYYLNLVYLVFDKLLKFYHIVFLFIFHPTRTYDFLNGNFSNLKKRLEIFVEKSPDLWNNSHWAICWYEKPSKNYQGCL
jgi:hypothetical protein